MDSNYRSFEKRENYRWMKIAKVSASLRALIFSFCNLVSDFHTHAQKRTVGYIALHIHELSPFEGYDTVGS